MKLSFMVSSESGGFDLQLRNCNIWVYWLWIIETER